jgi:aspartate-semialdehyde dehydrogenase
MTPATLRKPGPSLRDRGLLRTDAFIDGRWIAGRDGATFTVTDPANGAVIADVASLGAAEAEAAVDAAARAFPAWSTRLPQERAAILRAWFDAIGAAREDLAALMTLEQGKPLAESRGEIDYAASFVEWYAEEARRVGAETVASHLPSAQMLVTREPLGVAALLTPWNFPSAMLTRKAAAALAAGCTAVCHPSSETPLSALALAALAERVGIPAGVFNVVTGEAAPIAGAFCRDERVAVVSFTGSTQVGRLIAAQCAPTVKRLVMELGGNAPVLIFEDADLDRAVDIATGAKFATSGQDCLAANRIYVQRPVYEAFCQRFAERIAALRVGNGFTPGVDIGPLMHARAVERIEARVRDAVAAGARRLTPERPKPGPLFVTPALLADVPDDCALVREELFGPIAAVSAFDDEAEAIRRANATEHGLIAYVVTRDGARALRMSRALRFGMVAVNRVRITGAPIPFGGVGQSGMGREGARHGLEAFTDLKYTCIDLA